MVTFWYLEIDIYIVYILQKQIVHLYLAIKNCQLNTLECLV